MPPLLAFYRSSIGKKWVVALTGAVLIAYILGHLAGNLQIYISRDSINKYGEFLHSLGPMLWAVRLFLLGSFVLHIVTTIKLAIENRLARPQPYAEKRTVRTTTAARTMMMSGSIVLCFVIFHILDFTTNTTRPAFATLEDPHGRHDVYRMVILGFQNPFAAGFYILGLFLLCLHLSHGLSSFLQTLGLNSRKTATQLALGGRILAWLIFIGYVSIPLSVMLGFLKLPPP